MATTASFAPGARAEVRADEWIDQPGMPANAPVFRSQRLEALTALAKSWSQGVRPTPEEIAGWSSDETLIYLQHLPRELEPESCAWLEASMNLSARGNHEILVEWLTIVSSSAYEPALGRVREVLTTVGRMKYLRPLYTALGKHPRTRQLAREIFAESGAGLHAVARRMVEAILTTYPPA